MRESVQWITGGDFCVGDDGENGDGGVGVQESGGRVGFAPRVITTAATGLYAPSCVSATFSIEQGRVRRADVPMTRLGRSMMSRRMEKQNVQGTGAPLGLRSTQCEYTDCVVFSKAWFAKFSQYSTTDWFSKSCTHVSLLPV